MSLDGILSKRVLILSGKGGVGKSIVAAALALKGARDGKRILLVEMDTVGTLPRVFGKPGGEIYKEVPLSPNIDCLHVDGRSGLEEYLRLVLKSRRLTSRIFRSPAYQYFVNIAPGLKELMAVGKIWDLEQKTLPGSSKPQYDLFIVDTPATGHALSYLRMPMAAVSTLKRGFVQREAQKVVDLLQNEEKTSFNIVTTPAEMPANEAIELYEKTVHQLGLSMGCLFVNQVHPPFFEGPDLERFREWKDQVDIEAAECAGASSMLRREQVIISCAQAWRRRRQSQETHLERLKQVFSCPIIHLPFLTGFEDDLALGTRLADALSDSQAAHPGRSPG